MTKTYMWAIHSAAALWIAAMFALSHSSPAAYTALLQEDYIVEWLTVGLFAAAGFFGLRNAFAARSAMTFLVAAFCIFVAGEEFSWGQRLFGFTPPDVFLEHNTQQEFTLHNFADIFGKPKGVLIGALVGYAVILPLLARFAGSLAVVQRLRLQPPPLAAVPWLLVCAALLVWYPLEYTGEWVEAFAGALFLLSARPRARHAALAFGTAALAALVLTLISARGLGANPAAIACAQRETAALMADIVDGGAVTNELRYRDGSIHKRVWSAVATGYLDREALSHYSATGCGDSQTYVIDPWGMAYWIRLAEMESGPRRVSVYSMGPNRRRESTEAQRRGDDIVASGVVP